MEEQLSPLIQELVARQAIHDVVMRYCRGCDRIDAALIRSVFHEDAYIAYGVYNGVAREFVPWLVDNIKTNYKYGFHSITNEYVVLEGQRAFGELYAIIHNGVYSEGKVVEQMLGGRYLDQYERRQGEWRVAKRRFLVDWIEIVPPSAQWETGVNDGLDRGKASRSDASYEVVPPEPKRVLDWQ